MSTEGAPATSFGFQIMWLARFQRLVSFCIQYPGRWPKVDGFSGLWLQSSTIHPSICVTSIGMNFTAFLRA
jgi:hypothetical protein